MDHLVVSLEFQSLQNLNRKSSNQTQTDPLEIVVFNELIQVDGQQLE